MQLTAEEQVRRSSLGRARPAWVMDALWTATRPVVLPRADLLVTLDFPRRVSLRRLVARTLRAAHPRGVLRRQHRVVVALSTDSIVAWHFRTSATSTRLRGLGGGCRLAAGRALEHLRWLAPEHAHAATGSR